MVLKTFTILNLFLNTTFYISLFRDFFILFKRPGCVLSTTLLYPTSSGLSLSDAEWDVIIYGSDRCAFCGGKNRLKTEELLKQKRLVITT